MKYNKEKTKTYLLCAVAAAVLMGAVFCAKDSVEEISDGKIARPDYNEELQNTAINVYVEGEAEPFYVEMEISPKKYSRTQIEKVFEQVYERVKEVMLGENETLSRVTKNLNLITKIEEYPVMMEWYSSDYTLIDYDGTVYNSGFSSDEEKKAELTLVMSYEEYSCQYPIEVCVDAPELLSQEEKALGIAAVLKRIASESEEDEIQLPQKIQGRNVHYAYAQEKIPLTVIVVLLFVILGALWVKKYEDEAKQKKLRQEQLTYDYSEVIAKLTLLAGAGMTIRRAWEKVAYDYQGKKEKGQIRYVYEEMLRTCKELESGVSEKNAYERFGRRCNTKEYLKLASLLAQNVKKGTRDILRLMEEESYAAFEVHKNLAKKKGEEAGTKLLIPMIMMLMIVMVMMMFPAVVSFGI